MCSNYQKSTLNNLYRPHKDVRISIMSLLKRFKDSSIMIPRLMYDKVNYRNTIPHVSENFAIATSILEKYSYQSLDDLPLFDSSLDQLNYNTNTSSDLVFKLKDNSERILIAYRIEPKEFKYVVFHNSGMLQNSKLSEELCGYYVMPFILSSDKTHFECESFSYLIRPSTNERPDILPLLTLEPSIPDYIAFQWVFLAMRHFNKTFSNLIEYKYLATDIEEIELLKKVELYD